MNETANAIHKYLRMVITEPHSAIKAMRDELSCLYQGAGGHDFGRMDFWDIEELDDAVWNCRMYEVMKRGIGEHIVKNIADMIPINVPSIRESIHDADCAFERNVGYLISTLAILLIKYTNRKDG